MVFLCLSYLGSVSSPVMVSVILCNEAEIEALAGI